MEEYTTTAQWLVVLSIFYRSIFSKRGEIKKMKNIGIEFQRIDQEKDYTVVNNHILRDNTLSWRARGLFVYILSKPTTWKVYTKDLINQATEGRDAMRKAMAELIKAGYIEKHQINQNGTFGNVIYKVYQIPLTEKPLTEKPLTENQSTYKVKNKSNTELINKKEISKEKRIEKQYTQLKTEVDKLVQFPKDIRDNFLSYWTEPNRPKTKLRYMMEKTWDTKRRLSVWANRSPEYKNTIDYDKAIVNERKQFENSIKVENPATAEEIKEIMGDTFKNLSKGMRV